VQWFEGRDRATDLQRGAFQKFAGRYFCREDRHDDGLEGRVIVTSRTSGLLMVSEIKLMRF
jgi:hypothetical protein